MDRHDTRIDQSQGWVSLTEVRNVFVEYIRKLDREVWPQGGRGLRDEVIKHFETTQYELMKRAKRNYIDFTKASPHSILPPKPVGPESKVAREARLNRMSRRPGDGG